ncbi:hypothetical protein V8C86DRAFT_3141395, partial [Haematococcus lacustris]
MAEQDANIWYSILRRPPATWTRDEAIAELRHLSWGIDSGQVLVPPPSAPPSAPPPSTCQLLRLGHLPHRRKRLPPAHHAVHAATCPPADPPGPRPPSPAPAAAAASSLPGCEEVPASPGGPQAAVPSRCRVTLSQREQIKALALAAAHAQMAETRGLSEQSQREHAPGSRSRPTSAPASQRSVAEGGGMREALQKQAPGAWQGRSDLAGAREEVVRRARNVARLQAQYDSTVRRFCAAHRQHGGQWCTRHDLEEDDEAV